jgi:hypothetical protein
MSNHGSNVGLSRRRALRERIHKRKTFMGTEDCTSARTLEGEQIRKSPVFFSQQRAAQRHIPRIRLYYSSHRILIVS